MSDQTPHTPDMVTDEQDEKEAVKRERPDLAKPRGNPETDHEAVQKGKDVLDRVKPY